MSSRFGSLVFTGVDDDPETLATIGRMGFSSPPRVSQTIRSWHHGHVAATRTEEGRELFTRPDLVNAFSLERLGKSAAKFDLKKLQWLNGQHIRMLTPEQLRDKVLPILHKAGYGTSGKSEAWLTRMAAICQEKIPTLNEIVPYTDFFFAAPTAYEEKAVTKQWGKPDAAEHLERIAAALARVDSVDSWEHDTLKAEFERLSAESGQGLGHYVHPTRLALTGKSVGPGLFELTELLGRDESLKRIRAAVEFIRARGATTS